MAERDASTPTPTPTPTPNGDGNGNGDDAPQPWGAGAASPRAIWQRRAMWAGGAAVAIAAVVIGWPVVETLMPRAVTELFAGGDAAPDPAEAAFARRIGALETAVAGLDGRIAAAAAKAGAALPRTDAARLVDRIATLETRPAPTPPPPDRRIAGLVERVAALTGRLDALESAAAAGGQDGPARAEDARLGTTLARLTERIARLEAALDPQLAGKVESAGARVAGIEAELERLANSERTREGDALLLAVGQLREAAAGPRPFESELRLVLKAAGGDAGIADAARKLATFAPRGIPTRAALAARFPALAVRAAQAALAPEDGDWLDRTAARLARVVAIRRVGEGAEQGGGALSAIARAEARLAAGDPGAAAAALEGLDGAPARVFADWRAAAAARAAADIAIAGLSRLAVERFAARAEDGTGE